MSPSWNDDAVTHHHIDLPSLRMHYVEATPASGNDAPLVVLLHGFPEFWYSWRHQLVGLSEAGYRVVAPDLRGYGQTDKPSGVDAYQVEELAADVYALIEALGSDSGRGSNKASVVGHDWGGAVAWWHAMLHPDQVESLSILNCPHPSHQGAMMTDFAQLKRSWYMLFFQLPFLPERRIQGNDHEQMRRVFREEPMNSNAFSEEDIQRYVDAFDPASTHAALNYYRAYLRRKPSQLLKLMRPIDTPTQVIWGTGDRHLGIDYSQPPTRWVWDVRVEHLEGVSHWVQVDAADEVNRRLLAFLPALDSMRS